MTHTGHILIVEDDPDLAENLVEILEGLGWQAESVSCAEQGISRLREQAFDGVITDFRLPGLNGVELIRELRESGVAVPVVVMSALLDEKAADTAQRAGALDVLSKPIDLQRLFSLVEAFVEPSENVLIVDDNEPLAENVAEALRLRGLHPIVSSTARSALCQRKLPRVALVDLRLPDLNGVELARRLHSRDPRIKILFVTAYADELDQSLQGLPFSGGNKQYLVKPFDLEELVDRVKRIAEES